VTARFFYGDPDAPRPNRPIGVGVLVLIERGGELLMGKRSDCGRWGFVGGAVEVEESLEETGLVVTDEELFAVFPGPSPLGPSSPPTPTRSKNSSWSKTVGYAGAPRVPSRPKS